MTALATNILKLKNSGHSYTEIAKILNCSKGTISYHLGEGQKSKTKKRLSEWVKNNALRFRILSWITNKYSSPTRKKLVKIWKKRLIYKVYTFYDGDDMEKTISEITKEIESNPICYLTGQVIDLTNPSSYELDHKVPKSRGGSNTFDNMGICCKEANRAKSNLMKEELIELCKKILTHNGYSIKSSDL